MFLGIALWRVFFFPSIIIDVSGSEKVSLEQTRMGVEVCIPFNLVYSCPGFLSISTFLVGLKAFVIGWLHEAGNLHV